MSTGVTELGSGVIHIQGERFEFARGEKYVLFAYGKAVGGKPFETLDTSACVRNIKLSKAAPTIAVLDAIAQGDALSQCIRVGSCRNSRPGSVNWFDRVGIPVVQFRDGDSVFALRWRPQR